MKVECIAQTRLNPSARKRIANWREDQGSGSDAEVVVEIAGRTCYDSGGTGRSSKEYHKHILEVGHGSVLAHATWTFLISGVSRNLTHELVRHGVGTGISQRSTRYCDESESPIVEHPLIEVEGDLGLKQELMENERKAKELYDRGVALYQAALVSKGCDKLTAKKQARAAMARYLPHGLQTEIVFTVNARSARNIVEQRANPAADAEIRRLAVRMYEYLSADSPWLFGDYERRPSADGLGDHLVTPHVKV